MPERLAMILIETSACLSENGWTLPPDYQFLLSIVCDDGRWMQVAVACPGCLLELMAELAPERLAVHCAEQDDLAEWLVQTFGSNDGAALH